METETNNRECMYGAFKVEPHGIRFSATTSLRQDLESNPNSNFINGFGINSQGLAA